MTINLSSNPRVRPANVFAAADEQCRLVGHFLPSAVSSSIPLFASSVSAGFPTPAEDYLDDTIDLNKFLINHPAATFIVRAAGESMLSYIHPNDLLIVDRSITPVLGHIIIAAIDGQLTVKYLKKHEDRIVLMPANPAFKPIEVSEQSHFCIWGVVIHIIRTVEKFT